jgi:hypothetical protein
MELALELARGPSGLRGGRDVEQALFKLFGVTENGQMVGPG